MRIVQLQLPVYQEVGRNLEGLERHLELVADRRPDLVTIGEMFVCPYETGNFPKYAEPERGHTWGALSALAAKYGVYLSAGTVPELGGDGRVFNTAYMFDRQGQQIGKHRKMHLFDIHISGGQCFKESETLAAGDQVTVFDTEFGRIGLCVCYDFRFPELSRLMVQEGAKIILVPAAFNLTTGPAHWELMFRGRAVDNQVYAVGTSPSRDVNAGYQAWGHSILVSPWGEVIGQMEETPGYMAYDIDLGRVDMVRSELPLLKHRRLDLYEMKKRKE